MAQLVETKLVDDIDGSEGSETIEFSLDNRVMEIDLSEVNAAKLRDALAPFIRAGRRAAGSSGPRSRSSSRSARSREESAQIRSWLTDHGYEVSDRGRMPNELLAAYDAQRPAAKPAKPRPEPTGQAPAEKDAGAEPGKPKPRRKRAAAPPKPENG